MLDANWLGALGVMIADRMQAALGDLSPSAAALLSNLHFKPGLSATQLAAICGVRQPTAVRLIDGLVRQGLLARGKPMGRTTPLELTVRGWLRATELQAARLAAMEMLLAPLSPGMREQMASLVEAVLAAATTSRAAARTTCRLCEHDLCAPGICPVGNRASQIEARAAPV